MVLLKPVNWLERIWNRHLHQIFLHFEFNNNKQSIDVSFYNHTETAFMSLRKWSLKQSNGKLYSLNAERSIGKNSMTF